jgi:hypothetical protein
MGRSKARGSSSAKSTDIGSAVRTGTAPAVSGRAKPRERGR